MRLMARLEKSKEFWGILLFATLFFLLRLPSLIEPYWYGDEGIYQTLGKAILDGRILYTEIWDNKPPLLYVVYAFFNSNQFSIRLFSLLTGVGTLITFFYLSKILFKKIKTSVIVTLFFLVLFGLPMLEGNIANAENFMLLPILGAAYFITSATLQKGQIRYLNEKKSFFLAGILLGIAFLFKTVAIFDFTAFLLFYFMVNFSKKISISAILEFAKSHFNILSYYVIGFVIPFLTSSLYFLLHGAFVSYFESIFLSTVGYVGLNNAFIIPQGLLITKLILLFIFVLGIFRLRKLMDIQFLFIFLWVGISLFNSFFSQRPYTHYLLVLLPSFCLLLGMILEGKKKLRIHSFFLFCIITLSSLSSFNYWNPLTTLEYYGNFLSFITNNKSVEEYQKFFDKRVPQDTGAALYVKNHLPSNASVFYWGNSAQMYVLSGKLPPGRYTVAYHSLLNTQTLQETQKDLEREKPHFIVILPDMGTFPFPMYNYAHKVNLQGIEIYERIN